MYDHMHVEITKQMNPQYAWISDTDRAFTSSSNQSLYWTMLAMATSAPFM